MRLTLPILVVKTRDGCRDGDGVRCRCRPTRMSRSRRSNYNFPSTITRNPSHRTISLNLRPNRSHPLSSAQYSPIRPRNPTSSLSCTHKPSTMPLPITSSIDRLSQLIGEVRMQERVPALSVPHPSNAANGTIVAKYSFPSYGLLNPLIDPECLFLQHVPQEP